MSDISALGQFYKDLEPFIVQVVGALIVVAGGWVTVQIKKYMGITVDAAARKTLEQTATNAASMVLAQVEGPISGLAIKVESPLVAAGVNYVLAHAGPEVFKLGFTPQMLGELVLAKFGQAQLVAHDQPAGTPNDAVKSLAGTPRCPSGQTTKTA